MEVADAAFWRAVHADRSDKDAIGWGLELYQPKWGGDTKTLLMIAQMVEADPNLFYVLHRKTMIALTESGLNDESMALLWRVVARLQWDEAHQPQNPWSFYYMGLFGKFNGINGSQDQACIDAWTAYLKLRPHDARVHYELAWMLHYRSNATSKPKSIIARPWLSTPTTLRPPMPWPT